MIIKAYAKINLTLDITGIMEGGYHSLRSVMVPVSLFDEIEIHKADNIIFNCNIKEIATEDNLCVRAAKAFFEKAKLNCGAHIKLTKNIPFPAGLGGGSADAAAVLKCLNQLYNNPLSMSDLFSITEKLGSDVSLCLLGKAALCEGKGDNLTPLSGVPSLNVVIAIGEGRLSTPAVYKAYDAADLPVRNDSENFLNALRTGDEETLIRSFGNAFTPVTDILSPETKLLREQMLSLGAKASHLSGSGPSVYGIFASEASALSAAEALKTKGFSVYCCKTLN